MVQILIFLFPQLYKTFILYNYVYRQSEACFALEIVLYTTRVLLREVAMSAIVRLLPFAADLIFSFCGRSAAQVALLLVFLQDLAHAVKQAPIDRAQFKGHVLMYRAFTDPEISCRLAYRRVMLNDIIAQQLTPLGLTQI